MPHSVRDVGTLALKKLGVLRSGGSPSAADAEAARHLAHRIGIAADAAHPVGDRGHIVAQQFGRVALGVDADEHYFHIFRLIAQLFQCVARSQQFGRTNVGAVRITEGQDHDFAFQVA